MPASASRVPRAESLTSSQVPGPTAKVAESIHYGRTQLQKPPRNPGRFTYTYLDGRLRTRNTQTPAPGGGRIVTETSYDGRGLTAVRTAPYFNIGAAGSGMVSAALADLPSRTVYSYDNLQRPTVEALQTLGTEKYRTAYSYDGDRQTVTPPSGGASTSKWDAAGRTTSLAIYPTPSPTGTAETTQYGYNPAGELTTITDAAGNVTTYGYDLAGNRTTVADPDTGASSSTYNPAGDLQSTTDARGQKLSFEYDALGRVTTRWAGEKTTGTKLAAYAYDTLAKGQLTSATRYVGTDEYITEPIGYDDRYRPTGTRWTIPNSEGALAGRYETSYGYDSADHLTTITYPARAGLPAETVTTGYDPLGYATTLTGAVTYITATTFTPIGQLATRTYGDAGPAQLIRGYTWEAATGRLASISATVPNPTQPGTRTTIQDDRYTYLLAGDIAAIKDTTDGQSQCLRYDGQHRLTEAFTAVDNCAADPTTNVAATGKTPYWDSFRFDTAARRATDTHRTGTATTNRTYTYPAAGQPRTHAVTSIAVTGATTRTDTFGYDAAGNMRNRTVKGTPSTYTINAEGRFDTATVNTTAQTKHLYDADGELLIRTDPAGRHLYLGAEELTTAGGGNQVTGTRYYTHGGAVVATRTPDNISWLGGDHQTSATLAVDRTTAAKQRRWYTPYGGDRAGATGWPTDRGFLNAQTNTSTTLLDVGAREYDPDTGTFINPDPLVDPANPGSYNPYAYAQHNPVTLADPTGLAPIGIPYNEDTANRLSESGHLSNDQLVAGAIVAGLTVAAIAVCIGSAGLGCAIIGSAALGAGLGATFAPEGQRTKAAIVGGVAGGVSAGVGELVIGTGGIAAASYARLAAAGAAAGVSGDVTDQYLSTGTVDWRQTAVAGALGGILGPTGKIAAKLSGRLATKTQPLVNCAHSFAPNTNVLMADGTTKPIKDIEPGDHVTATDPDTGTTQAKPVEQLHHNQDSDLTDLTITIRDTNPADGTNPPTHTVLHTTQHHPFWDQTSHKWVNAANLTTGHQLRTTTGDTATITTVHNHTARADMRDLTITDTHTYYVIAGNTPVLVHNCGEELWRAGRPGVDNSPQDWIPMNSWTTHGGNLQEGNYHFVVMPNRSVRAFHESIWEKAPGAGHTSLSRGKPVIAAGTFDVGPGGIITDFDNFSGHYQPSMATEGIIRDSLGARGFDLSRAQWNPFGF
jgi:RHS repeat-associated protein